MSKELFAKIIKNKQNFYIFEPQPQSFANFETFL